MRATLPAPDPDLAREIRDAERALDRLSFVRGRTPEH